LWDEDWQLFADKAYARILIESILGDLSKATYVPRESDSAPTSDSWRKLREELQLENRYFPKNAPDQSLFGVLMANLATEQVPADLFRARLMTEGRVYRLDEMGAPPMQFVVDGRANPSGIRYLYLADDPETAIAEVKPSKGALVAVAKFEVAKLGRKLRLIDLTNPRACISPFLLSNIADVRASMPFLESLGEELSVPTQPHRAMRDYLASQYLCELVKVSGYDGVVYRSSVGAGKNFTFFDVDACIAVGDVGVYEVVNVTVAARRR